MRKRVTAIITEYRLNSHAEVIVGRLLGELGYEPQVELVSLYVDQFPDNDMIRELAANRGIPIYTTIEDAVAHGAPEHKIDGIVVIGEHGKYPWNEKKQHLYPRYRFMEEILAAMDRYGIHAPIFLDKHFSYDNEEARWIYEEVKKRDIPFMAGSSIPYTDQMPAYDPAFLRGARTIFVVSHGGHESYGFHAMEVLQSLAEQRNGAETGVSSVQALACEEMWEAMERGEWPEELMLRAFEHDPNLSGRHPRGVCSDPVLFIVKYNDGLTGYVAQLHQFATKWSYAVQDDIGNCITAHCNTDTGRPYHHFATLTSFIEDMVIHGKLPCRMERNLLTTYLINTAMESLYVNRTLSLPELNVTYKP